MVIMRLPPTDIIVVNNGEPKEIHSFLLWQIPFFQPMLDPCSPFATNKICIDFPSEAWDAVVEILYSQLSLKKNQRLNISQNVIVEAILLLDFLGLTRIRDETFEKIKYREVKMPDYIRLANIPKFKDKIVRQAADCEPLDNIAQHPDIFLDILPHCDLYYATPDDELTHPNAKILDIVSRAYKASNTYGQNIILQEHWETFSFDVKMVLSKIERFLKSRSVIQFLLDHDIGRLPLETFLDLSRYNVPLIPKYIQSQENQQITLYQIYNKFCGSYQRSSSYNFGKLTHPHTSYDVDFLWSLLLYECLLISQDPYIVSLVQERLDGMFPIIRLEINTILSK